jgi:DNA (cytosine-5)-methyltransferase 3A
MENKGINVLSLFDGMSCGQIALERAGIEVDNYFASEIDKYAIKVTMANYPNTIQLGSVVDVKGSDLPKIDLLIGGSPCQSFSFAGKRKGMATKCETEITTLEQYLELKSEGFEFEGQSYLFWEYMRLLNEVKPKYFLLENVMMSEKWEKILTKAIGINPIMINSSLVSAQNRKRFYWTNIGAELDGFFGDLVCKIKQPKDKKILLKDILEKEVDEKYFLSEKLIAGFKSHKERHDEKGTGFGFKPKNENDKGNALRANAALCPTDNMILITGGDFDFDGNFRERPYGKSGTLRAREDESCSQLVKIDLLNKNQLNKFNLNIDANKSNTLTLAHGRAVSSAEYMDSVSKIAKLTSQIRRLTPTECERLQTVKDGYTNHISDSQRYKMLGNGWTVDVIAHIFKYLKNEIYAE